MGRRRPAGEWFPLTRRLPSPVARVLRSGRTREAPQRPVLQGSQERQQPRLRRLLPPAIQHAFPQKSLRSPGTSSTTQRRPHSGIAVDCFGGKRRGADRDVFRTLGFRGAVADPLPCLCVNGLTRADIKRPLFMLHPQHSFKDNRIFVKPGTLARLLPAAWAAHVGNAHRFSGCIDSSNILIDELWQISGCRDPGGLNNVNGHEKKGFPPSVSDGTGPRNKTRCNCGLGPAAPCALRRRQRGDRSGK